MSTAVAVSRSITCFAVSFGYFARISATTPATIAVELLVPLPAEYLPPGSVDMMSVAGADTTTSGPVTEISAWFPVWSVPATATTPS